MQPISLVYPTNNLYVDHVAFKSALSFSNLNCHMAIE